MKPERFRLKQVTQSICIYRSLHAALYNWLQEPVTEYWLFFMANGFQLSCHAISKDGPVLSSIHYVDHDKAFASLSERLGIDHYYHKGPIVSFDKIVAAVKERKPVLLFTHVNALPYDKSGGERDDAYHCIRVLHQAATTMVYADDFVPNIHGGFGKRFDYMDFEENRKHFIGYLIFVPHDKVMPNVPFHQIFIENLKHFLAGGQSENVYYGITALNCLLQNCRVLQDILTEKKRFVDIMVILKYQLYAAYGYLLSAAEELHLFSKHSYGKIKEMDTLWRVSFLSLQSFLISGKSLYFNRFIESVEKLVQVLIIFITNLVTDTDRN